MYSLESKQVASFVSLCLGKNSVSTYMVCSVSHIFSSFIDINCVLHI